MAHPVIWLVIQVGIAIAARYIFKPDEDVDYERGIRSNTRSVEAPLKIIYGETKVGGNDVFITTSGSNNQNLWIVQTIGEGELEGIATSGGVDQVWLDDKLYNQYGGNVNYYFHSGSSTQTADSNLNAVDPTWTDCLKHTSYMVWRLHYDSDYFRNLPQRYTLIQGKKLYDFRDATTAYSNNPVLCLYDYFTNTRYGLGFSSANIDTTTWTSAANYCDTKGWEFNGAFSTDDTAQKITDSILAHFRGTLVWYDGKIYLKYSDLNYESSVMTITDSHIVQDNSGRAMVSISQPSRFERPNSIRVTYTDPTNNYTNNKVLIGDETGLVKDLVLEGCTDRQMASDLGTYYLERALLDRTISGVFRDDTIQLEPHDVVTFTSTELGVSSETLRVVSSKIRNDGLVDLVMQYDQSSLYDDNYSFDVDYAYECSLPDPASIPPNIDPPTITEEHYNHRLRTFTRLNVEINFTPEYPWLEHVEVWRSFDNSTWVHLFNVTDDFSIDPVEEGVTYYLKLYTVSIWGTKSSGYVSNKDVTGYGDVPDSVSSLTASVNANTINLWAPKVNDTDVELYEFRLGASYVGGIFVAALRSPNMSISGAKPGTFLFWVNTLSNNGLYGSTPRSAAATLADPPKGWTVNTTHTDDYQ